MKKRFLAMLLCLAMIFSSSNVAFAAENLGTEMTEEESEAVGTVEDTKIADTATIKIHFRNENKWTSVNAWLWQGDSSTIAGYEKYHTSWPGGLADQDAEHLQWFTLEVKVTDLSKDVKVIFSNNGKDNVENEPITKTNDIIIEKSNFQDGSDEVWVYPSSWVTRDISYDDSWGSAFKSILIEDGKVTFRYKDDGASSLYVAGSMNDWSSTANKMTKSNGVWTCTFDSLKAGRYEYKFVKNGNSWFNDPENGWLAGNDVNNVFILPGIVLAEAVEATKGDVTKLPSSMLRVNEKGEEENVVVSYALKDAVEGASIEDNYLTLDDNFTGDKVQLLVSNEFGDTATLDVTVVTGAPVKSPVVEGNSVTFNYRSSTASSVYVAGSMTDTPWEAGKVAMIKDPETNIWSVTLNGLPAGQHQYKFIVDGKWILDPKNDNVGIEDGTKNSLFVIKGDAEDNNKITVKIHYTGRSNYDNWNVYVWNDSMAGAVNFDVVNGERIATIELDSARANQYLNFIVRKGDWDEQEFGDRTIDLSDLLSGTAHVYVTSGQESFRRVLEDALLGVKIKRADYDRIKNQVILTTALPVEGDLDEAFDIECVTDDRDFKVKSVTYKFEDNINKYVLTLDKDISSLENVIKYYNVVFDGHKYKIHMPNVYSTEEFESKYTYTGDDLGATWTSQKTTFKLWAPTADDIDLNLYESGTPKTNDLIKTVQMVKGDKGVWTAEVAGNLDGTYYTYSVTIGGKTTEACDPYARTTGVNGKRAMVINLDGTDPAGWNDDVSPNQEMNQTDAIIYELHVRDLSINENSGVSDKNKGKYLGVTETGTKNTTGQSTGLDHIVDLGVTHIHFLPIYDYGSVDETKLDTPQFNWGYDPVNYNVPEGSYSTDPYNGEVRVAELKEMIQTLHENNINVVMDVVYNHVYDAGAFAFNQVVPDYFSRTTEDGYYSSRSGCGNDTASERDMVRKYIVESVVYWAEEYHIDGFRFDLVGLIDVNTINQIVEEVHEINPSIIFYGEGWDMDGTVMNPREPLAKQGNSYLTPGFAYFSDTIRDLLRGNNDSATTRGYVSGLTGKEEDVANAFMARTWWTSNPTQIVNYASCHDNYTVMDKLNSISNNMSDKVKMNNLSAAIYMLAEGVPLIHAGEEMLRTKVDEQGHIIHNSYKSSDYVNSLKWANLNDANYQKAVDYYTGLIEFRKNHEALRLTTADEVNATVEYFWITNEVVLMKINGKNVAGEISDGIIVIFNPTNSAKSFNLYNVTTGDRVANIEHGTWNVCIDDEKAGIEVLRTVTDGNVTVDPISALVLVKGATVDTESVYLDNGYVPSVDADYVVNVTKVKLNQTNATMTEGKTLTLKATVYSKNATNKTVTWSSSNNSVVTVDSTGKVTAVGAGKATITAKAGKKTATCEITVNASTVPVTSITLDKTTASVEAGKTVTLKATVKPDNATNKTITWSTTDATIATVSGGVVTAKKAGTVTITATADGKSASCKVTVTAAPPAVVDVTSITLDQTKVSLKKGATVTLKATVNPSNATNKTVTWSTSNASVAKVDNNGKVTAAGNGTAVITAKAGNKTATCTVIVTTDVASVSLSKTKVNVGVGKTYTLKATVNPTDASNQTIKWSTSDKKIAEVDQKGNVKAKKAGTAVITVTAANGKTATCTVTVVKVTLNATSFPLQVGKSTTALKATSSLKGDKVDKWSSSNESVATVDKNGKIKAGKKTGTADITVSMKSGATAKCTVTVQKGKVTTKKLTLDTKKVTVAKGQKVTLTVTRNPISATEKITWKSSNSKVATVKNGVVTAKKAGTVTITAQISKKVKVTCKVTVKNPSVKLERTKATIKVKESTTIKIKSTFPENDKVVSYKSSNSKIATVDKNGVVTGKKAGTATITVKMKSGATAKFKVTVKKK